MSLTDDDIDQEVEEQFGCRLPDGRVKTYVRRTGAMAAVRNSNEALASAGSTEVAVLVSRTKTVTYTEWEAVTGDE